MLWIKNKSNKEIKDTLERICTRNNGRPGYIPLTKKIENIKDLTERFNLLEDAQIRHNNKIINYKAELRRLEETIKSKAPINVIFSPGHRNPILEETPEEQEEIVEYVSNKLKSKIEYEKDCLHTIEDEMDWLNAKVNIHEFNFDPNKNHV